MKSLLFYIFSIFFASFLLAQPQGFSTFYTFMKEKKVEEFSQIEILKYLLLKSSDSSSPYRTLHVGLNLIDHENDELGELSKILNGPYGVDYAFNDASESDSLFVDRRALVSALEKDKKIFPKLEPYITDLIQQKYVLPVKRELNLRPRGYQLDIWALSQELHSSIKAAKVNRTPLKKIVDFDVLPANVICVDFLKNSL